MFINQYQILCVDEFWFAHRIYQYKDALPYRDFSPYKTVLGYYLLVLPMLFTKGIMTTLISIKNFIAVINGVLLFIASTMALKWCSHRSVTYSLLLLMISEYVLTYSTNIRIDLLGYWACLFGLIALLNKRYLIAGCLMAVGFATTQKSIWYIAASDIALLLQGLWLFRSRAFAKSFVQYNATLVAGILLYLLGWSAMADWHTVTQNVFFDASAMYQLDWYDTARALFWRITILYNPLVFLAWPLTLISLTITYNKDKYYAERFFIVTVSQLLLLFLICYKQVFPYYMQVLIPIQLLLYASFFNWLIGFFTQPLVYKFDRLGIVLLLGFYLSVLLAVCNAFDLPAAYYLIGLLPLFFITFLFSASLIIAPLTWLTLLFTGVCYPTLLSALKLQHTSGAYQQANIETAALLLQDHSAYIAGAEVIYNQTQPVPGVRHLMGPAIEYLYHPTDKLRAVMLESLYEDPKATQQSVINNILHAPVKFYINNYRMHALPPTIKKVLNQQYSHWWGSIYLYAPSIQCHKQYIDLKFTGQYQIDSTTKNNIILNGRSYLPGKIYTFLKGRYYSQSDSSYRLKLTAPQVKISPQFSADNWERLFI